jgi:hypothetical protein
MFLSAIQHRTPMLVADQSMAAALRAVLSYQTGFEMSGLDVSLEGPTVTITGSVSTEQVRQKLLDVIHEFTAIPISCLVTVRAVPAKQTWQITPVN